MTTQENAFVTIAFEYTPKQASSAGFFCLWETELTFVRSAWIRVVAPTLGIVLGRVVPAGPEDTRTRTRIAYTEIAEVSLHDKRKKWLRVATRNAEHHFFGGGQLNSDFDFPNVSNEMAKALSAAGLRFTLGTEVLAVMGEKSDD